MSAKDMYPIPTPVASRSRPAGVGDLRVPFSFFGAVKKKMLLNYVHIFKYIYIYILICSIFEDLNDRIITKKSWFSGSSPTGKPLRKLMHSPPSRWFVLPASVVWAGLHVPRRWDEKENIYTLFWVVRGGLGVFWVVWMFAFVWMYFLVVASLNVFLFGGCNDMMQCFFCF